MGQSFYGQQPHHSPQPTPTPQPQPSLHGSAFGSGGSTIGGPSLVASLFETEDQPNSDAIAAEIVLNQAARQALAGLAKLDAPQAQNANSDARKQQLLAAITAIEGRHSAKPYKEAIAQHTSYKNLSPEGIKAVLTVIAHNKAMLSQFA